MKSLSVTLKKIECLQTNETGKDELFVQVHAKEEVKGGIDLITTCPKNQKGYWSIKKGDVIEFDEILFVDKINHGIQVKCTFIEEDVTGLLVHKAIQELIDDYIGEINIFVNQNGEKQINEGKNTKLKEKIGNDYIFSMMGSGAHYIVTIHIK